MFRPVRLSLKFAPSGTQSESGIGVALVMEFSCNQDTLCLRPLEPALESGCVLVWKKNQVLSPAMLWFIEHVKEYLEGITQDRVQGN